MPSAGIMASAVHISGGAFPTSRLVLWLDATDESTFTYTATPPQVATWTDKSANGHVFTPSVPGTNTIRTGTINGLTTVTTAGSDPTLIRTDRQIRDFVDQVNFTDCMFFAVVSFADTSRHGIYNYGTSGTQRFHMDCSDATVIDIGPTTTGRINGTIVNDISTAYLFAAYRNGATMKFFRNGLEKLSRVDASGAFASSLTTDIIVNVASPTVMRGKTGEIIHVGQYDAAQFSAIHEYLRLKWGIGVASPCVEVLEEPFNNLSQWTLVATNPTIVSGRTGTAVQVTGSTGRADYTIPSSKRSQYYTIGFAWRFTVAGGDPRIFSLWSDGNTIEHIRVIYNGTGTGSVAVTRGGTNLGTTIAGVVTINTWHFIELQVGIHDTGSVILKIDGVERVNIPSIDTMTTPGGATNIVDTIRLGPQLVTLINQYDDLYITSGASCAIRGDAPLTCTPILEEPFDNLTAWETTGTPTLVSGRTGTGVQLEGISPTSGDLLYYRIPDADEAKVLTLGFAWKVSSVAGCIISAWEADGNIQTALHTNASGGFDFRRGMASGVEAPIIVSTANGLYTVDTWYYIEWQIRLSNSGYIKMRINGSTVIDVSDVDTRGVGSKLKFDALGLGTTGTQVQIIDDLYLSSGEGCEFRGTITPFLFQDPCNNTSAWTVAGTVTVVSALDGNGFQFGAGTSTHVSYNIPSLSQSDTVTVGFNVRWPVLVAGNHDIVRFRSDSGATGHVVLRVDNNGAIRMLRDTDFVALGAATANGVIVINTWYRIEVSVKMSDTIGSVKVRLNGTTIIDAGVLDTKSGGTKTVLDQIRFNSAGSQSNWLIDNVYIRNNAIFMG